jgi:hypothetical protein
LIFGKHKIFKCLLTFQLWILGRHLVSGHPASGPRSDKDKCHDKLWRRVSQKLFPFYLKIIMSMK